MSPALGGGVGGGILGVFVLLFIVCICLYAYILYRRKRQATAGYQQAQEVSSQTYTESPGNILVQETSNNQPQPIMLLQPNNAPSVSTPQPALCCTHLHSSSLITIQAFHSHSALQQGPTFLVLFNRSSAKVTNDCKTIY